MIKIFTLWMGEKQIYSLIEELILVSRYVKIQVIILPFFPNKFGHDTIYKEVNSSEHVAVKIDGDMNILDVKLFLDIVKKIDPKTIEIHPVYDHITRTEIMGVHFFGGLANVRFKDTDQIFPDKYKTGSIIKFGTKACVDHCRSPTSNQIKSFLRHRAKKFLSAKNFKVKIDYFRIILKVLKNHFSVGIIIEFFRQLVSNKFYKSEEYSAQKEKWAELKVFLDNLSYNKKNIQIEIRANDNYSH